MTGLVQQIDLQGIEIVVARLHSLAGFEKATVLSVATGVAISSTHERLRESKTAPDGTQWADWSDDYAKTRKNHHSLLMGEGNLDDSITEFIEGDTGGVGTNLIYGAIQQFGGEEVNSDITARPYLGLSPKDETEIEHAVGDYFKTVMQ